MGKAILRGSGCLGAKKGGPGKLPRCQVFSIVAQVLKSSYYRTSSNCFYSSLAHYAMGKQRTITCKVCRRKVSSYE